MNTCYNPFSLDGKTILVTGASSGIGRAIAVECSKLGARVIVNGRNEERLKETVAQMEGAPEIIVADLTDSDQLDNLLKNLPVLNGVVLCAGVTNVVPIKFITRKKVNPLFEINLFSQIELLRLLYKKNLIYRNGSVVAISSIGGNFSHAYGNAIYGSSKAALSSFMKYAAKEMAKIQIRVNSICPGMVNTPMTRCPRPFTDEDYENVTKNIALGRFGEPVEIAHCAAFLLSEASSWITGIDIRIDGGHHL